MELVLNSKSTWNPYPHLKKVDVIRLYNTLAKSSNREEEMRRMIYFPPEHNSTFENLIKRITYVFDKHECLHADYKNDCYKEFEHLLNEFQESFSDSGEPVRFRLIQTPTTKRTPTPKKRTPSPTKRTPSPTKRTPMPTKRKRTPSPTKRYPARLPHSVDNLIYNMSTLKIKMFVEMILNCKTNEEKKEFLKKYLYVLDVNNEPFPGLVDDIIVDILDIVDIHESPEFAMERHFKGLMSRYGPEDPDHIKLYILYPFPVMHFRGRTKHARANIHNLGGRGKRRRTRKRKMKY